MFRFSIRELLLVTVIVAMGLGWWLRERELHAQVEQARDQARKWRGGAGVLEHVLRGDGCMVEWHLKWSRVLILHPSNRPNGLPNAFSYSATDYEPSDQND
jgi:hypothetical protein